MAALADLRQQQREETRRRVYLAALEVFRRDGVDQARIEDVARRAEVSRPTFYFHFPTREDVLRERLRESQVEVTAALEAVPEDAGLEEVLARAAEAMASAWERDRVLFPAVATVALRTLAGSIQDPDAEPVRAALAPRFEALARRGAVRAALPPRVLADFYLSNVLAAMLAGCANPQLPLVSVLAGVNELFLRGVLRPSAPTPEVP